MATVWAIVLSLPGPVAATTWPWEEAIPRRPVTASSRPTMTTTIHEAQRGIRPIDEQHDQRGRHDQLVGQRVEELSDPRDVLAAAAPGEPAIQDVGHGREDERPGHEAAARNRRRHGQEQEHRNDPDAQHRHAVG